MPGPSSHTSSRSQTSVSAAAAAAAAAVSSVLSTTTTSSSREKDRRGSPLWMTVRCATTPRPPEAAVARTALVAKLRVARHRRVASVSTIKGTSPSTTTSNLAAKSMDATRRARSRSWRQSTACAETSDRRRRCVIVGATERSIVSNRTSTDKSATSRHSRCRPSRSQSRRTSTTCAKTARGVRMSWAVVFRKSCSTSRFARCSARKSSIAWSSSAAHCRSKQRSRASRSFRVFVSRTHSAPFLAVSLSSVVAAEKKGAPPKNDASSVATRTSFCATTRPQKARGTVLAPVSLRTTTPSSSTRHTTQLGTSSAVAVSACGRIL
mmetsp:Transcript_11911/g.35776  ORF Transcript_11911/g.35776 Transcript_11911/m.35776 type:complete len:323 (+) Transcript_11911:3215-4183(+)